MSGPGLFDMLHDLPEHVHVFEDMEQLWADKKAVGYLRSATWGDANMQNRVITKTINKQRGCNLSPAPESRLFSPKPTNSVRDLRC